MNVSREEALDALADIDKAGGKMSRLQSYRHSSSYFFIWGLVWFAANLATYYLGQQGAIAWPIAIVAGIAASFILGMNQPRQKGLIGADFGKRLALTSATIFAFVGALMILVHPQNNDQANAIISILFAFAYMFVGIWLGWRLVAIGLITAAAILVGYFYIDVPFSLWMAFVGGGALITGGLWLRSA